MYDQESLKGWCISSHVFTPGIGGLALFIFIYDTVRSELPERPSFDFLTNDVLVYVAGAVALLALLVAAYYVTKYIRSTPGKRLQSVLAEQDAVSILMHPNPDPDAMAAALGVAKIADTVNTDANIEYTGQIRHQENRAFRTVLNMECEQIETASEIKHPNAIILVDHNSPRGFTEAEKVEPIAVVDHHPGNGTGSEFTDVRTEYGATATILTEYLDEIGAVSQQDAESVDDDTPVIEEDLATGLLYGIQSDTKNLTRGCIEEDFNACAALFAGIDESLLDRIANPQVSHDVLKVKATAITDIMIDGSFGVCNVGEVENVDSLSQAADELMRLEGVTAVIVYGKKNGTINISGRSRDDRVHMGECLQHAVGDINMASAGGHARMGGGQVPTSHINGSSSDDGLSFEEFNDRLFTTMHGDH